MAFQKGHKEYRTKETFLKISQSRKGVIPWNKGIPRTKEEKIKISNSHKGKKRSIGAIEKQREKMIGRKYTEEHKRHMRENNAHYWKGKIANNKGKTMSINQKEKISMAKKGKFIGEKSPRWTGGSVGYWMNQAKIRDHFTCRICGLYDPEIMEVDHIKPKSKFYELSKDINNMQTLCPNCHRRKTKREGDLHNNINI